MATGGLEMCHVCELCRMRVCAGELATARPMSCATVNRKNVCESGLYNIGRVIHTGQLTHSHATP